MGSRKKANKGKSKGRRSTPREMHQQAIGLYREGRMKEALEKLQVVLKAEENSERWNDWAAVQHALGSAQNAEAGFRKALDLDKNNQEAAANLGCVLVGLGRHSEAAPFLHVALNTTNDAQRAAVQKLMAQSAQATKAAEIAAGSKKAQGSPL